MSFYYFSTNNCIFIDCIRCGLLFLTHAIGILRNNFANAKPVAILFIFYIVIATFCWFYIFLCWYFDYFECYIRSDRIRSKARYELALAHLHTIYNEICKTFTFFAFGFSGDIRLQLYSWFLINYFFLPVEWLLWTVLNVITGYKCVINTC